MVGNLQPWVRGRLSGAQPRSPAAAGAQTRQAQSLDELLFALIVLGDDRVVEQTVIGQQGANQRATQRDVAQSRRLNAYRRIVPASILRSKDALPRSSGWHSVRCTVRQTRAALFALTEVSMSPTTAWVCGSSLH